MKFTIDKKIGLFVVTIIITLASVLGFYFLRNQARVLSQELNERVSVLLNNLSLNLEYPVLIRDREAIARLVEGVMAQQEMAYCRVEGTGSGILYEAGIKDGHPLREFAAPIVTKTGGGGEGLILNVPGSTREGIGKIYLQATLSELNRKIYDVQRTILAVVIVIMLLSSLAAFWLLKSIIGTPIAQMVEATERISRGDLTHKISISTRDELGTLAASFNEMTESLANAHEELVRKEKLATLGQLSGSVGHELRNPLGVMSNAVYFLQMVLADADETTREYLGIIKKEIDNSQRIITDLLDFARTKPPQTRPVAPSELVEQSLEKCAIPENVALRVDVPGALPPLRVDPLQMGQVLQNLITNGVQAMQAGGTLRIAACQVSSSEFKVSSSETDSPNPQLATRNSQLDGDFVEISVHDTGEGIAPENMKKLFQPLFTTKAKGIGLGLVVCRNLAEANGGRIAVESEPGKGTTFTLTLPAGG